MKYILLVLLAGFFLGCNSPDAQLASATPGPAGPAGPQGPAGPAGSDGITSGFSCSAFDSGSGITVYLRYTSVLYTSGDRFVSCSVGGGSMNSAYSQTFKASQIGATNAGCTVTADLDNADGGWWGFSVSSGGEQTVYSDTGSTHDGYKYSFASGDCTTF